MEKEREIYTDNESALRMLSNNGVLTAGDFKKTVYLHKNAHIGIKLWGAVDYLVHYGGYLSWERI